MFEGHSFRQKYIEKIGLNSAFLFYEKSAWRTRIRTTDSIQIVSNRPSMSNPDWYARDTNHVEAAAYMLTAWPHQ